MSMEITLAGGPLDGDTRVVPDSEQLFLVRRAGPIPPDVLPSDADRTVPLIEYAWRAREDEPTVFEYVGERQVTS